MSLSQQSEIERILSSYFKELDAALASVPEPGREQLVSEIREHVDNALAHKPPSSPWDVRELLQRVGTPKDIAAAATEEEDPSPQKSGAGAQKLVGWGAFLLLVMGLSVALLIAFAAPNPAPTSVRTRIKVEKEAAATATTTTTSGRSATSTTTTIAGTSAISTTTGTSPMVGTPTTAPTNVSALTSTGTTLPTTVPQSPAAANSASMPTITIGGWTGVEPQTIWFSADAGNVVTNIIWMSWGPSMGVGQGKWGDDNCVPDCAEGTVTQYDAIITVLNPSDGQFTQLSEQQTGLNPQTLVFTLPDRGLNGASSGSVFDQ